MADKTRREAIEHIWANNDQPLRELWLWWQEPDKLLERYRRLRELQQWADDMAHRYPDDAEEWQDRKKVYRRKKRRLFKRLQQDNVPGIEDGGWHPNATRTQVQGGIGGYLSVAPKLVWHTTEGTSLPTYSGSHPHFTINPQTGQLFQHISIRSGAMALKHDWPGFPETNRAHAIQVEIIGYAGQSHTWSDAAYDRLAALARWIEKHADVARTCSVVFQGAGGPFPKLSGTAWYAYRGHIGHQDIPGQDHWDPGALRIGKII